MSELWIDQHYDWMYRQAWPANGLPFWSSGTQKLPLHVIVVHSTETLSWPGYRAGADAPHFTLHMVTGQCRQHIPLSRGARALTIAGSRLANNGGVVQIECIGACDPHYPSRYGHYDIDQMPDPGPAHLARLLEAIHEHTDIPLESSIIWVPYPASYGRNASQRLTEAQYLDFEGILGHQHVVGNDHGDPGDIPIMKVLSKVGSKVGRSGSVFYLGARGEDVAAWQTFLEDLGYDTGAAGPDGVFGARTDTATKQFQSEHGLDDDGRVGPATQSKREHIMDLIEREEIAGEDRYATAAAISREAFPEGAEVVYLLAHDGLDGVAASRLPSDGPFLLVRRGGDSLHTAVRSEIERLKPQRVRRIGDSTAVTNAQVHSALQVAGLV